MRDSAVNTFPATARARPSRFDWIAVVLVLGLLVFLAETSRGLLETLSALRQQPISLDPSHLPEYAARTTLRMLAALGLSLLFTFTYATWAAKSRRAGRVLIPLLDLLQSVPILGFISVTVVFFLALVPGRVLGAELAAVFAIFTSQAWNMAFSFYQSLRTVPVELQEAAQSFGLTPWSRFWRLEVPFAMPALTWNMMMSMSGGWFFVVAAEAISVGHTTITLPGMGAYIATAIAAQDLRAIGLAILAMLGVILLYDQLLFRPLVAWSDQYRFEQEPGTVAPRSWVLEALTRSTLMVGFYRRLMYVLRRIATAVKRPAIAPSVRLPPGYPTRLDWIGTAILGVLVVLCLLEAIRFLGPHIGLGEIAHVLGLGLLTGLRVLALIAIASLVWVPVGIWVGLSPRLARIVQPVAQFLAAFPANLLFPVAVYAIVRWKLDADVWLSPLMILGTQWYILFNVIAGASAIPTEMRHVTRNLEVRGWAWWHRFALPAVFPYYVTGALTASGGSWNASIVAEAASWGTEHVRATGLGSYIAEATTAGDFHRIVLGIAVMAGFVIGVNRFLWRPLYALAERKYRMT
ncbi:MAG: ABC transporter permease subunit [Gammaproteobacteria bacterium]|nr:ABC transporter permease subunit [Gammaproteobacteria bacterium]